MPWPSDFLKAYPTSTPLTQPVTVRIKCTPGPDGALADCSVLAESPSGLGLGPAALGLATKFKLTPNAAKTYASGIVVPIGFEPSAVSPPWRDLKFKPNHGYAQYGAVGPYYPDRAARYGVSGEVVADCHVPADRTLDNCRMASVFPADMGFDDAVMKMIEQHFISAADPPGAVAAPADGVWRFRVEFDAPR